jgi:hypothetical protein
MCHNRVRNPAKYMWGVKIVRQSLFHKDEAGPFAMPDTIVDFNDFNSAAVKFVIGSEKSVDPNRLLDLIFWRFVIAGKSTGGRGPGRWGTGWWQKPFGAGPDGSVDGRRQIG